MLIHREALALANNALAESDGRYCLNFVRVTKDGDVIAVDGHHFLRMRAKVDEPTLLDAMLPEESRDHAEDALIPADVLASFAAAIKKMDDNAHVVIASNGETITLASTDGICERTFISKPPALPFPDVDKLIGATPFATVTLNVKLMEKVLKTLKACGVSSFRLGFHEDPEKALLVGAWSESGPIDGVIMPMRPSGEAE